MAFEPGSWKLAEGVGESDKEKIERLQNRLAVREVTCRISKMVHANQKAGLRTGMIGLPDDMPLYNGGVPCDMAIGPCSCGAWHHLGETRQVRKRGRR